MTLAEALVAFEKDFTVSEEVGFPDEALPSRLDMDRAPTGARYVTITSGGSKVGHASDEAYFTDEGRAAEEWLRQAWSYSQSRKGGTLYWRIKPHFSAQEYLAVNQAALMNDPRWRQSITLRLGTVYSRLLITKAKEGKE